MALTARRTEPITILQRERSLRPDLFLVLPYLGLAALGIIMVYTASAPRNELLDLDPATTMRRHIVFVLIGFAVFLLAELSAAVVEALVYFLIGRVEFSTAWRLALVANAVTTALGIVDQTIHFQTKKGPPPRPPSRAASYEEPISISPRRFVAVTEARCRAGSHRPQLRVTL